MATEPTGRMFASLALLTFLTGLADAASVLGLGHIFTANVTGNVVFLWFRLAGEGDLSSSRMTALLRDPCATGSAIT
jgi:uncharacterized membrane protein YoaK (UPF0700 family)